MLNPHPRPYHRGSVYGDGPRMSMCRDRRAFWKARLNLFRRAKKLTPLYEDIGLAMLRRLGTDGQLDPSQQTIAEDVGCDARSVRRALVAFRSCGLVIWSCRMVRAGWRAVQTSNAYVLTLGEPPVFQGPRIGGQKVRETRKDKLSSEQQAAAAAASEIRSEARTALARVTEQRQAAIRALLLRGNRSQVRTV